MELSKSSLPSLPRGVRRPNEATLQADIGIVHFGVGGFHRRHQALYTQDAIEAGADGDWGIAGVGLLDSDRSLYERLRSQEWLYSVVEQRGLEHDVTVVGSLRDFIFVGGDERERESRRLIERLSSEATKIVTLTVTEKGYFQDTVDGGLLLSHPTIEADLNNVDQPRSAIGFITVGLEKRRQKKLPPFTVLSCDNVPGNGAVVKESVMELASRMFGKDLEHYISSEGCFPCTMSQVDGITPSYSASSRTWLRDAVGIDDAAPVFCEKFRQWVIEDNFVRNARPPWELAGAQFVRDVTPFELVKIRLLNVPHSALTYAGYLLGFTYVHEAITDADLLEYIRHLSRVEIMPTLVDIASQASPPIDLRQYSQTVIGRFGNEAIQDTLERVAQDGSSKYATQLVPIIKQALERGSDASLMALAIATWARHLGGISEKQTMMVVTDGRAAELAQIMKGTSSQGINALVRDAQIFGSLERVANIESFRERVAALHDIVSEQGVRQGIRVALQRSLESTSECR